MVRRAAVVVSALLVLSLLVLPEVRARTVLEADLAPENVFSQLAIPGFGNVVLFATNSLQVDRDSQIVSGDLVVNEASPGPTLNDSGFELELKSGVSTAAGFSVRADSVELDKKTVVGGDVVSNELANEGTVQGSILSPLDLPVFDELPTFEVAQPRIGDPAVVVPAGGSQTLAAGNYDAVQVGQDAVLTLSGGTYHLASLTTGKNSSVLFEAPTEIRMTGRLAIGRGSTVGPTVMALGGSDLVIYVGGFNGVDGQLGSEPPAANVDKDSALEANIYAPFGTLILESGTAASGAFLARDLLVKKGSVVELDSFFVNRAPTADPQTVFTSGADPIEILLTGSDPEGGSLTFSIVTNPTEGTLSNLTPIVPDPVTDPDTGETAQPPTTSATVTYTPDTAEDREDSFVFQVEDPAGGTGMATVTINPPPEPVPPPPDTVIALDVADTTVVDTELIVTLGGDAPAGVDLTFEVLSGPGNGTLGPLTPGSESPVRTATATYTPDAGFTGTDAFDYQACGIIDGVEECDTATYTIDVIPPPEPQDLARDQEVTGFGGVPTGIDLSGGEDVVTESSATKTFVLTPKAAFLEPVDVAGNVADADGDGLGDNHNDLPGSTPIFMSAGVDGSGGPGSNGTRRMHMEWDLSDIFVSPGDLVSADVLLNTHRGTTDSLDTFFFAGGLDEQGTLEDSDFESVLEQVPGVVMPVPQDLAVGEDGTFSFSVLAAFRSALEAGAAALVAQGRVDESLTGPARGLEVRTSASGNIQDNLQPQLSVTTPGVTPEVQYTVTTLPVNGTLFDSNGVEIQEAGTVLPGPNLTYQPAEQFLGSDSFEYEAQLVDTVDSATIFLQIVAGDCLDTDQFCDDGR